MKILSIGNSFSQDAQRYLHRLAKCAGDNIKTVNLYIGGCSLQRHYLNMLDDVPDYAFEFNGEGTGLKVSIRQALISDDWDVITLQQASHFSGDYETYSPYIQALAAYVRKYCPHTKIFIHQTWAYEDGTDRIVQIGYQSAEEMYQAVRASYQKAAEAIGADGILPCGEALWNATQAGIKKIHRDGFHASLGVGRYILALTWYKTLTGKEIAGLDFADFDVPVTCEEKEIAVKAVEKATAQV